MSLFSGLPPEGSQSLRGEVAATLGNKKSSTTGQGHHHVKGEVSGVPLQVPGEDVPALLRFSATELTLFVL